MDNNFAKFFKDQCIGGYSGHMAEIKFNPVIAAILMPMLQSVPKLNADSSRRSEDQCFADVLREIADALDTEKTK